MYSKPLRFQNGSFKLMQISDVQELARVNPDSIKLLTLALEDGTPVEEGVVVRQGQLIAQLESS